MALSEKDHEYRLGVGIIIFNKEKQVLVGQRSDSDSEAFQMPQGGIDDNETPLQAVLREMLEEIGTNNVSIIHESKLWYKYKFPDNIRSSIYQGKYIGQKQKWFLAKFLGLDSEIDINSYHKEFRSWKWINLEDIAENTIYFKKNLYEQLIKDFSLLLKNN